MQKLLTRADIPDDAITVSPSQLKNWYDCEYRWNLIYNEKIGSGEPKSAKAENGNIFHLFQQLLYNKYLHQPVGSLSEIDLANFLQEVDRQYPQNPGIYSVFAIWQLYAEWAAKKDTLIPIATEVDTFADTGLVSRDGRKIYLHGIIDLLAYSESLSVLADHKSHTNNAWTRERLLYDHQLVIYWILCELQGYHIDVAMINSVNLFIPKDTGKFRGSLRGPGRYSRFDRIYLTEKDISLQFYLNNLLDNIKAMWCGEPKFLMRLADNCQFCGFRDHIAYDATGRSAEALVVLRSKHGSEGDAEFTLEDDDDGQ